ncbi:MAG: hypothetical protein B5M56_10000 [Desulfococcus sp. 4484_241]|nr:MAG: hypothetical protein B5M56_10000 [Desulfococcus sp. 4484_241]
MDGIISENQSPVPGKRTSITAPLSLLFGLLLYMLLSCQPLWAAEEAGTELPPIPTPGMVTMLQLESDRCPVCKMMGPVITELKKEYEGIVSIITIDVGKHRDLAMRLRVFGVPTQILYDREGRVVGRHMGYLDKKSIKAAFEKLGVYRKK